MNEVHPKVSPGHLSRDAYLYVRQSTVRQVSENTESTRRQYALRERAVALGWPADRVVVIDTDLGESGADRDREGFQRLVAEVGMGHAGIVLGLEVSRLARNSIDWHRLLEICALSDTLILDEDGIYDPADFNDRLLLGLKGTMSEAELHMLHARLRGGLLNQARRGALKLLLPVGLVYDPLGRVVLDPDAQVQRSIRMLFDTFARTGSAGATVRYFRSEGLDVPQRPHRGAEKGQLRWQLATHPYVLNMLHNPRYAGAYADGRSRRRRRPDGSVGSERPPLLMDRTICAKARSRGEAACSGGEARDGRIPPEIERLLMRPARRLGVCRSWGAGAVTWSRFRRSRCRSAPWTWLGIPTMSACSDGCGEDGAGQPYPPPPLRGRFPASGPLREVVGAAVFQFADVLLHRPSN